LDSLTQSALGAAVGDAVLGSRVGRRALVWGAVCGTLPDLDVLVRLGDPVRDFTFHRSWSHSLLIQAAFTPVVAGLILRLHPDTRPERLRWHWLAFLALATHSLLDSFTVYGTQIFWPLPRAPETWSTVFIIDPLYTLPLLIGVIAAFRLRRRRPRLAGWLNAAGLALSTLYLGWTVFASFHVETRARDSLARQGIAYERLLATPMPFNSLLWRVLAMDAGGYSEGFYSVVADGPEMTFDRYPSRNELLESIASHWPVARLQWFTKGFYSVERDGAAVVMTDLRMGAEPDYIFRFAVAEVRDARVVPVEPRQRFDTPPLARLGWVWRRIWEPISPTGTKPVAPDGYR
jgi:inner membrane protein